MLTKSKFLRVVLPSVLAASVLTVASPSASAISVGACWSWNMDNKATGTFLTDGTHNGTSASAGTYTLSDFKVDSSIYPSVENGSISNQTYSFGTQPPYSFIWDGSAPTTFQRQGYTNGFAIYNGVGGSGAYLIFDINFSFISDSYITSVRLNNTQTISLSPTARSNCDTTLPDGTYLCSTGVRVNVGNPVYTITSGVVTNGSSCAGAVRLPNGVLGIGDNAFKNASAITSITIPSTVTTIGSAAFQSSTLATISFQG